MKWRFRLPRWRGRGGPRASRRVLLWGGVIIVAMVAWMTAPLVMRRLAFFRVRQVELVGIRHLDAADVVAALRLPRDASVFDDTALLTDRVRGLDGVADAAVVRRPPGSLKVIVREIEPIALVTGGALSVVDATGKTLPFAPGRLDLPVVLSADSGVVSVLARIQALDPALFQAVDAARRTDARRGDVLLELRGARGGGAHRVLLGPDAGPEVIQAVTLVARDLAARARPYGELDARFAGQVVVRRRSAKSA